MRVELPDELSVPARLQLWTREGAPQADKASCGLHSGLGVQHLRTFWGLECRLFRCRIGPLPCYLVYMIPVLGSPTPPMVSPPTPRSKYAESL